MTKPAADASPTNDAKPDPRELARQRAEACGRAVEAILTEHRCRIVPYLLPPEPVGTDGSRAIIGASFGIVPNA